MGKRVNVSLLTKLVSKLTLFFGEKKYLEKEVFLKRKTEKNLKKEGDNGAGKTIGIYVAGDPQ